MPTENPKISAYVPQIVYDRFKQYQEEHKFSMSHAATEIFAHYFELDLEISSKESTSKLPSRLTEIEQSLEELKKLYIELASKVDYFQTTSRLLHDDSLSNQDSQVPIVSELLSKLKSKPSIDSDKFDLKDELLSNPQSELPEQENLELPVQLNFVDSPSDSLSSSLKELSLSATKLGKRLSIDRTTLGSRRKKASEEEFAKITSQKDPDAIKWVYSEQLKSYTPHGDLSLQQIESLKLWKSKQSTK